MIRLLLFSFLLFPLLLRAQFTYIIDQNIPVSDLNGNLLSIPWAGGLNAAQHNTMDVNNDGKDDLILFDRMANKVITLISEDNQYLYHPEYDNFFPADISNWLLLRDYNCDGKKDIFTGDVLGIKVYTNITAADQPPQWQQFFFYTGFPGSKSPVLLTQGNVLTNLQIQFDDLPSIEDADGDGDLDIFNMQYAGNGTIEFHQNLSIENNFNCDSLQFKRITRTWGNVKECFCGRFAFNGETCPPHGGRTKHAGGKSLLLIDVNGDQQKDLLFSEAECGQLFQLLNKGDLFNPVIDEHKPFPVSHPANFLIFPAPYFEDVDFDGKKDLICSPNIFSKEFISTNLKQSNWFYKNSGTNETPVFTFVQSDFLQDQMIDVGDNAVPAFADYDGDGDYDMFISRNSSQNFNATIFFYENTGTADAPSFRLTNEDFLFFSFSTFYNLKIQFTDINNDNTIDLVWTATDFDSGVTDLYYFANKSQNFFDFSGQSVESIDFNLSFNENIYVTDVDGDGQSDILAGRSNGALQYYRNTATTPGQFQFTMESDAFLGLGSSVLRQNISTFTSDLDADGLSDLIYGDQTGIIKIISNYKNVTDPADPVTQIVFNPLLENYGVQNLGGRIWPVAVNIFNSNRPAIITGNIMGGATVLRHEDGEVLPGQPVIDIYPNPVKGDQSLNLKIDRPSYVQLISVLGQQLSPPKRLQAHEIYSYKLPTLSEGLYLIKFTVNDKSYTKRLVITD